MPTPQPTVYPTRWPTNSEAPTFAPIQPQSSTSSSGGTSSETILIIVVIAVAVVAIVGIAYVKYSTTKASGDSKRAAHANPAYTFGQAQKENPKYEDDSGTGYLDVGTN